MRLSSLLQVAPEPAQAAPLPPPRPVAPPPPPPVTAAPAVQRVAPEVVAKEIGTKIGEPVDVRAFDMNLVRAAMTEGVLVTLTVRWWRGTSTMSLEDEGLSRAEQEKSRRRTSKSMMILMPHQVREAHVAAEAALRRSLRNAGMRIEGYAGYFIPVKSWDEFKKSFNEARDQMRNAVLALAKDDELLEKHRATCEREFRALAPRAWRGHREDWDDFGQARVGAFTEVKDPPPTFIDWFATRFLAEIPTAEIIRDYLDVRYSTSLLFVPEVEAAMEVARGNAALQSELKASLRAQREDLPMRFIRSIRAEIASEVSRTSERLAAVTGKKPGEASRALTAIRKLSQRVDEMNLARDPVVAKIMERMLEDTRMAEARANGAQRPLQLDAAVAPLQHAAGELSKLTILDEGISE